MMSPSLRSVELAEDTDWPTTFGIVDTDPPAIMKYNSAPSARTTIATTEIIAFLFGLFLRRMSVRGPDITGTACVRSPADTAETARVASAPKNAPPLAAARTGCPSLKRIRSARNSSAVW